MFNRPKAVKRCVPLDALTFDARLQFRACTPGFTCDDATADAYAEKMEQGEQFPPLEAVEEPQPSGKQPKLYVFAGFTRAEAYRRRGVNSVEVLVYPGTFRDAEFYALSENTRHGAGRRPEECRAAFARLMDSRVHLERALAAAKGNGGTQRAIAAACGIAKGSVPDYLLERGLRVDRLSGKLVPADGPESPERDARRELVAELEKDGASIAKTAKALGVAPATIAKDRKSLKAAAAAGKKKPSAGTTERPVDDSPARARFEPAAPVADTGTSAPAPDTEPAADAHDPAADLAKIAKTLHLLAGQVERFLDTPSGDRLRVEAQRAGVPFAVVEREVVKTRASGNRDVPLATNMNVETWPALEVMRGVFGQVSVGIATAELGGAERD